MHATAHKARVFQFSLGLPWKWPAVAGPRPFGCSEVGRQPRWRGHYRPQFAGDLPDWVILTHAVDINNVGQVIAIASGIPEPEIYTMLLAGLGLVGFVARRKKMGARAFSA
ncbi:MAG: PEP-CTERM sorting domain-containing protein [Nitrosospira sp.]|nr:PEP-CTERM sorting domain-containing protein [Nitrosospira sp.]